MAKERPVNVPEGLPTAFALAHGNTRLYTIGGRTREEGGMTSIQWVAYIERVDDTTGRVVEARTAAGWTTVPWEWTVSQVRNAIDADCAAGVDKYPGLRCAGVTIVGGFGGVQEPYDWQVQIPVVVELPPT